MAQPRLGLSIEDVEGRQADVGDFLLTEKNPSCIIPQRDICWRGRRCTARHGQGHASSPNAKAAALLVVRFVARFALAIVELRVQIARNLSRPCSYELVRENLGCWVETPR